MAFVDLFLCVSSSQADSCSTRLRLSCFSVSFSFRVLGHSVITLLSSLVYSCYLIFQLVSHRILFEPGNSIIQKKVQEIGVYSPALARKLHIHRQRTLLVSSSLHPDNDATNCNEYRGSVCSLEAGPVKDKGFTAPYHMNLPITIGLFLFVIVVRQ